MLLKNKKIRSWFEKLDLIDKKKKNLISRDNFEFINNSVEKPSIIFTPNDPIESIYMEKTTMNVEPKNTKNIINKSKQDKFFEFPFSSFLSS